MRIAVYIPSIPGAASDRRGKDRFAHETLQRMIAAHPEHTFTLFSDGSINGFPAAANVQQISPGIQGNNAFSLYPRLHWRLPALLKKQGADVLLSMDGFLPLRSHVPACLVVQDISFAAGTAAGARLRYLRRHFHQYLVKAGSIAAVSDHGRKELIARFNIPGDKITVVHKGVHENFHPLNWEEREQVKSNYSDGREYFIYTGAIHQGKNIINLLKAFSILKKRLRSNMVLVLAGTLERSYKAFPELLRTYHFRHDIKLLGHIDQPEIARLTGAAYALVCPSVTESFGTPVLEALKCRVPVLAAANTVLEETGGDAALYFDPSKAEDMGDKFCEIYKDENLRARLIASADAQAAKFSWDKTATQLWACLEAAGDGK